MTRRQPPRTPLGALPALWVTVAFDLSALMIAVVGFGIDDEAPWPIWLPVASLAVSGVAGVVCLFPKRTRPLALGCLGGTAVSAVVYLLLFVLFVVIYFVAPGGHELS